ncbi:helix-turn-helix transcriptional regulator [Saccharopolyspora sp. NPDC047091]|uniref:helix-turn-helix domain-containing protein n=1 Tax=Saccharopolyspora sp. NPDC047091 TaxID=3155924 RepID=UPI0033F44134
MPTANASSVRGQELGEQLRVLRSESGLNMENAARRIDMSFSQLSRIEGGRRRAAPEVVAALLATYGVTGRRRATALALAREHDAHGWWRRDRPDFPERQRTLISLESKAERIVNYTTVAVPGLLQTGEYMRATLEEASMLPGDLVEKRMETRMSRHAAVFDRRACSVVALIDELVLHRRVGGPHVLVRQLEQLVYWSTRAEVTIRVLPNERLPPGGGGSFQLIRQRRGHDVVFLEHLGSSLFVENAHDVATYRDAVRGMLDLALGKEDSVHLIEDVARNIHAEAGHEHIL